MSPRPPRFFVIDPSFTDITGHNTRLALSCLESAEANGYQFHLITHVDAPNLSEAFGRDVSQSNVFPHAFSEHDKIVSRHTRGILRDHAGRMARQFRGRVEQMGEQAQHAMYRGDHIRQMILEAQRDSLLKEAQRELLALDKRIQAEEPIPSPFNRDDFALGLFQVIRQHGIRKGDFFFFHTTTPAMLESLFELSNMLGGRDVLDVDAAFFMHFGIQAADARTFVDRFYSFSHMGSLEKRLRSGSPFARLHFLTTNELLREEMQHELGLPAICIEDLTHVGAFTAMSGGLEAVLNRRKHVFARGGKGDVVIGVRAGDLVEGTLNALVDACQQLRGADISAVVNVLYVGSSLPVVCDAMKQEHIELINFIDVRDPGQYCDAMADTTLVVLPYDVDRYEKRVSGVLMDCSVIGVPCVVPSGTTLATHADRARVFVCQTSEDLAKTIVSGVHAVLDNPEESLAKAAIAREISGEDLISRIARVSPNPGLEIRQRGPLATVVKPMWGRAGSSFAMEAQIRFLVESGYFVHEVLVPDKAVKDFDSVPYLWKMLHENSHNMRGHVQRIAMYDEVEAAVLRATPTFLATDALTQVMQLAALADPQDANFSAAMASSELTVVNHVFNTTFAMQRCGGFRILETHDVQSKQMVMWPARNVADSQPEKLSRMLAAEAEAIMHFDHIINVARHEDRFLSLFQPRSTLITPYITIPTRTIDFQNVAQFGRTLGWDNSNDWIEKFDILIIGDSHPANCEAGRWFIKEVFIPYLQPQGRTFAIAGRISDVLFREFDGTGYIFFLGFVEDLAALRGVSRIAVLPDRRGTGISIKTLEAFASGMPFVLTSTAIRGLHDRLPDTVVPRDEPAEMAAEICLLLDNPAEQLARGELALAAYEAVSGKPRFDAEWRKIIAGLGQHVEQPRSEAKSPSLEGRLNA